MNKEDFKRTVTALTLMASLNSGPAQTLSSNTPDRFSTSNNVVHSPSYDEQFLSQSGIELPSDSNRIADSDESIAQQQPEPLLIPFYLANSEDPYNPGSEEYRFFVQDQRRIFNIIRGSEIGSLLSPDGFILMRAVFAQNGSYFMTGIWAWEGQLGDGQEVTIYVVPNVEENRLLFVYVLGGGEFGLVRFEEGGRIRLGAGFEHDDKLYVIGPDYQLIDVTDKSGEIVGMEEAGRGSLANGEVIADVLNLRPEPGLNNTPIFSLPRGTEVEILNVSEDNQWYFVVTSTGRSGWVNYAYIQIIDFFPQEENSQNHDKPEVQNLRVTPSFIDWISTEESVNNILYLSYPENSVLSLITENALFYSEPQINAPSYKVFFSLDILNLRLGGRNFRFDSSWAERGYQMVIDRTLRLVNQDLRERGRPLLNRNSEFTLKSFVNPGFFGEHLGPIQGRFDSIYKFVVTLDEYMAIRDELESRNVDFIQIYSPYRRTMIPRDLLFFNGNSLVIISKDINAFPGREDEFYSDQAIIASAFTSLAVASLEAIRMGAVNLPYEGRINDVYDALGCGEYNAWCDGRLGGVSFITVGEPSSVQNSS